MKITSGAFLIALLLCLASLSVACASQTTTTTQDAKATPRQGGSRDDSSAPTRWKRYDFDKPLAFSIILPSEPEQKVSTFPDQTETSHVFISKNNSGVYGAIYISDLTAVASRWGGTSGNEFFYEVFIKNFAMKLENKGVKKSIDFDSQVRFTNERVVTVSDLAGWERDFSVGDAQGRAQLLRVGEAGFCLVALWKQNAPPAERDAFFNSVKITSEGS